jgi:hypothetical protein
MAGLTVGANTSFVGEGYVGDPPDYSGFPVIVSQNKGADAVGTPYSVALPPGFQTGDRLFVLIKSETVDNEYTFPARWTKVFREWDVSLTVDVNLAVYELIVDGSADASETSPISVSIASGGVATWLAFRVTGAHASAASEAGVATFSNASTAPDPPNLAPSWGTEKTLWIAVEGGSSGGTFTTAFPLPNFNERSNDASGGRVSAASIRDEVSSKDPGAFTLDSSVRWIANTIAVRPASAVTDASIAVQMTATFADAAYGDEVEDAGLLYEGVTAGPREDAPVDTTPATAHYVDPTWILDEDEWTPDWAQAPPKDVADETGETRGQVSNNDWIDDDEPVTDGWFSAPPDFEENAPLDALLGELFDDDEPVVEFWTLAPLHDAPVVTVDDVGPQESGPVWDDDEPLAGDWQQRGLSFPDDETGETTGGRSINDLVDDEEPVADGTFGTPVEETATDQDYEYPPQADVYDDDEPVTDGWFSSPTDEPVVDDISGQLLGEVFDDDEPVTDGWFGAPFENAPGQNDDITDTSFPADDDLEDEYPQAFADGFTGSPLEDTPPVVTPPLIVEGGWIPRRERKKKRHKDYLTLREELERWFRRARGDLDDDPAKVLADAQADADEKAAARAVALVAPFMVADRVDWEALMDEARTLRRVQQAVAEYRAAIEDEEDEDDLLLSL